ncbi:MAG: hypothetical protein JO083_04120 [Candidatus Eremiobacteraeota bacterium]|nr:hypothetical protein [Candidatus Eremiobacteraeota bacterium]
MLRVGGDPRRVRFVAVDNPHANELTIDILVAVAANEVRQIAERTRDGGFVKTPSPRTRCFAFANRNISVSSIPRLTLPVRIG